MNQSVVVALNAADASAATAVSGAIPVPQALTCSVQCVGAGTMVGVLKIQASNDVANPLNGEVITNWSDISGATVAVSAAGVFLIPKTELSYNAIRIVYTKTSSTGTPTISANVVLKAF